MALDFRLVTRPNKVMGMDLAEALLTWLKITVQVKIGALSIMEIFIPRAMFALQLVNL